MSNSNEQQELYYKALHALNKAGKQAEHVRETSDKRELDVMNEANRVATSVSALMPYSDGQYDLIFNNGLKQHGYVHNKDTGHSEEIHIL